MNTFAIGLEDKDIHYLEQAGLACITMKQVPYWARPFHDITVYGGESPILAYVSDVSEQYPYVITVKRA